MLWIHIATFAAIVLGLVLVIGILNVFVRRFRRFQSMRRTWR